MNWKKFAAAIVVVSLLAAAVLALAGCSQGKPQVIIFLGKSSKSYAATKAIVDEAQKKYGSKVTFTIYDYDSPKSASGKKKYFVSMDPTIIITNAQGQIKQTYMGMPMKDELLMTIESFIPQKAGAKTSTPTSTPNSTVIPGTPYPSGSTPGVSTLPVTTVPSQQQP
ncbi:MAG TPA: hypothetical protein VIJ97_03260 [Candidatus Anoxymicrobiaceae bacterium]